MNEHIRKLALEAGLYYYPRGTCCMDEMFPRHFNVEEAEKAYTKFADLVATAEREACAKICDEGSSFDGDLIRKRGNNE